MFLCYTNVMMEQTDTVKTCTKCGMLKPATLEYFSPHKGCRNGLNPVCRECQRSYLRAWKRIHAERIGARRRALYAERTAVVHAERERQRKQTYPLRIRAQIMRQGMIDRSRKMSLPFDRDILTVEYIIDWIRRTPSCPCCGIRIDYNFKFGQRNNASPSIDRVNSGGGYTLDNVALICWRCNNLKRDATVEELEAITRWMRGHPMTP